MKYKNIFIVILVFIIFILLIFITREYYKNKKSNNDLINLLSDQYEHNYQLLNDCVNYFDNGDSSFFYEKKECQSMLYLINYLRSIENNLPIKNNIGINKIIGSLIKNPKDSKLIFSMLNSIKNNSYSLKENKITLLILENYMMNNYLTKISQNLYYIKFGKVINVSQTDTVNFGEKYCSELKFVINDINDNDNFYILQENINCLDLNISDTIHGGIYEVLATKKGLNSVNGIFLYKSIYSGRYFKFNIEYYVK